MKKRTFLLLLLAALLVGVCVPAAAMQLDRLAVQSQVETRALTPFDDSCEALFTKLKMIHYGSRVYDQTVKQTRLGDTALQNITTDFLSALLETEGSVTLMETEAYLYACNDGVMIVHCVWALYQGVDCRLEIDDESGTILTADIAAEVTPEHLLEILQSRWQPVGVSMEKNWIVIFDGVNTYKIRFYCTGTEIIF